MSSPILPPGPILIIVARVAEIDCPVMVKKETWPWSLPRRLATVPSAMTMPLATIMGSGPAKAARLSSKEVFKVIVCCLKITLFITLKAEENRKGRQGLCTKPFVQNMTI